MATQTHERQIRLIDSTDTAAVTGTPPARRRLHIEALEQRIAPTTMGGDDPPWSEAENPPPDPPPFGLP